MRQILILVLLIVHSPVHGHRDLTLVERGKGADVVRAVISKFDVLFSMTLYRGNPLWRNTIDYFDSTFMRSLAYIESLDGTDPSTYRNGYFGGIWQVDESKFLATKDPNLASHHQTINSLFGLKWGQVEWVNLTKPLYSVLAAKLFLASINNKTTNASHVCGGGPPSDIAGQARYWNECYHDGTRDEMHFISIVSSLTQNQEACRVNADIMFVLDSSGSINHDNSTNWDRMKQFARNYTQKLRVGSGSKNRIGVITFGDRATVNININHTLDSTSLLNNINSLPYLNEKSNTADGLCKLTQLDWRPNILRVALVVTDGRSNELSSQQCGRIEEAVTLIRNTEPEILVYVIGVTANVREWELASLASSPEYVDHLNTFDEQALNSAQQHQTYRLCFTATSLVPSGNQTIQKDDFDLNEKARYRYNITGGMTIRLCTLRGNAILFASLDIPNPNEAYNDFILNPSLTPDGTKCVDEYVDIPSLISNNKREQYSSTNETRTVILYVSIEGRRESSSFSLESITGNTTQNTVSCEHDPCGTNTVCSDELIGYSCNCSPGFEGDALMECTDINECGREPLPCDKNARCANMAGGHTCECDPGYQGNGRICKVDREWIIAVTVGAIGGPLLLLAIVLMAACSIWYSLKHHKLGTLV